MKPKMKKKQVEAVGMVVTWQVPDSLAQRLREFSFWEYRGGLVPRVVHPKICTEAADEIEQLQSALRLLATGESAAAGSARPMAFKEWVRLIARTALTTGKSDAAFTRNEKPSGG